MKFKPRLRTLSINMAAYKQRLHEVLTKSLADATQEWIKTAVYIIPVWSGASVGTFLPLLEQVQGATLTLSPKPKPGAPNAVQLGKSLSEGTFTADATSGKYTFSYSTDLPHLLYNEYNNANLDPVAAGLFSRLINPGPYHFQEQANRRFQAVASQVRLPNPFEFLND